MSPAVHGGPVVAQAVIDLDDALHDLAQPLTVLAFLTQLASKDDLETCKETLDAAAIETKRAITRLKEARVAVARLIGDAGYAL